MKPTLVQLSIRVLENVASNARLIRAVCNALLQIRQHVAQILVAARAKLLRLRVLLVPDAEQGDIVLPVVARGAKVGNHALDVRNLVQQRAVHGAVDAEAVVEGQRGVEGEARHVRYGVDVDAPALAVLEELADARRGLEIKDGHVGLYGWPVEGGGGGLAALLA